MFGRMMNETWGKVHFTLTFIFGNCVFFPMHLLGTAGLRRRIADITYNHFEAHLLGLNQFMSICAFILGAVQIIFLINFFYSLFRGKVAGRNPWHSNSLEWTTTSPAQHGNCEVEPVVYRGTYEYGAIDEPEDYLPQTTRDPRQFPSAIEPAH
jgi:cytochrome c oxidase subunit 1